jgi:hypothetical protein
LKYLDLDPCMGFQFNYIIANSMWIGLFNRLKENADNWKRHGSSKKIKKNFFLKKYYDNVILDDFEHTRLGSWTWLGLTFVFEKIIFT